MEMVRGPDGLQRIAPLLPVHAAKTFHIVAPLATHFRAATCAEVGCPAYLHGWQTSVDEATERGQAQAHYIRHDTSRRHAERRAATGLTVFGFEAGQRCFAAGDHRIRVERPERFLIRGGDWRGNPRGEAREHASAADWQEDFAGHQDRIRTAHERG
jgi:hypothetical protein